jgi:hypothetical protein
MGGAYVGQFAMYATVEIAHQSRCATNSWDSSRTGIGIRPSQPHENEPAIRSLQGGQQTGIEFNRVLPDAGARHGAPLHRETAINRQAYRAKGSGISTGCCSVDVGPGENYHIL